MHSLIGFGTFEIRHAAGCITRLPNRGGRSSVLRPRFNGFSLCGPRSSLDVRAQERMDARDVCQKYIVLDMPSPTGVL